jgi:hypothetical protein
MGSQIFGVHLTFRSARCLTCRSDFGYLRLRAAKYKERLVVVEVILESEKRVEYNDKMKEFHILAFCSAHRCCNVTCWNQLFVYKLVSVVSSDKKK